MFRLINWLANGVLFPLTPMLAVWFFKGLETGSYKFSNLSATDLAFATAMICVVSIVRIKNLGNDPYLQESMSNIFSVGLVGCLILFTAALLYQVQAETLLEQYYNLASESIKNGNDVKAAVNGIVPTEHDKKIDTFRVVNAVFACITVIAALFCNFKYDLDRP
ncbi:hypothetical protein ACJJI4_21450 [Microbulbifer sp. TRSA002]|uniref:hypothetical protein n=1 Tax=Microbulbifer sp. TRSA002 TaxID=3243382 RepID=UPI00403A35F1